MVFTLMAKKNMSGWTLPDLRNVKSEIVFLFLPKYIVMLKQAMGSK